MKAKFVFEFKRNIEPMEAMGTNSIFEKYKKIILRELRLLAKHQHKRVKISEDTSDFFRAGYLSSGNRYYFYMEFDEKNGLVVGYNDGFSPMNDYEQRDTKVYSKFEDIEDQISIAVDVIEHWVSEYVKPFNESLSFHRGQEPSDSMGTGPINDELQKINKDISEALIDIIGDGESIEVKSTFISNQLKINGHKYDYLKNVDEDIALTFRIGVWHERINDQLKLNLNMDWEAAVAYAKDDICSSQFTVNSLPEFILRLRKIYNKVDLEYQNYEPEEDDWDRENEDEDNN